MTPPPPFLNNPKKTALFVREDQFFQVRVLVLIFGTKFLLYLFRYFFSVSNFSSTGSETTRKNEKFPVILGTGEVPR